jgi:hypothetical protein
MDRLKSFIKWNERQTEFFTYELGLSQYQTMWIAWTKGILTVLILQWIF